eukprot:2531730-Rhodomonas_salina.1
MTHVARGRGQVEQSVGGSVHSTPRMPHPPSSARRSASVYAGSAAIYGRVGAFYGGSAAVYAGVGAVYGGGVMSASVL